MLAFYRQFIEAGGCCFDIGANLGNRTRIFSQLVGPTGRVVAVEPQSFCMAVLRRAFGGERNVMLEHTALGAAEGTAEIRLSNETTVASMAADWIAAVRRTNRFGEATRWDDTETVSVTTLDRLIVVHGEPQFIKIDVEGFEKEVIAGLSRPLATCLSLEFTPEYLDGTVACLDHLGRLGGISCNYSLGESMQLALDRWCPAAELIERLARYRDDTEVFGDIYVRLSPSD